MQQQVIVLQVVAGGVDAVSEVGVGGLVVVAVAVAGLGVAVGVAVLVVDVAVTVVPVAVLQALLLVRVIQVPV